MSFDNRLFSVDDYMPVSKGSKKRSKGIDRNGDGVIDDCMGEACGLPGYGKKKSDEYFEAPGFFGGLTELGGAGDIGIETGINEGLPIQELGAEYNTRFGNIGTGFTEAVDPYQIGFKDILTGNGRTGEIISESTGYVSGTRRGRGRPKGSTKGGRVGAGVSSVGSLLSEGRGKGKGKSKGVKFGKAIIGGEEGESVSSKYIEPGIKKTGGKIKEKLFGKKGTYYSSRENRYDTPKQYQTSGYSEEDIEAGRQDEIDTRAVLRERIRDEQEQKLHDREEAERQ